MGLSKSPFFSYYGLIKLQSLAVEISPERCYSGGDEFETGGEDRAESVLTCQTIACSSTTTCLNKHRGSEPPTIHSKHGFHRRGIISWSKMHAIK